MELNPYILLLKQGIIVNTKRCINKPKVMNTKHLTRQVITLYIPESIILSPDWKKLKEEITKEFAGEEIEIKIELNK